MGALVTAFFGFKQLKEQKEYNKKQEKLAVAESLKPSEDATEQKKVDLEAKARNGMQQTLWAGARKGSIATGGTTLSA